MSLILFCLDFVIVAFLRQATVGSGSWLALLQPLAVDDSPLDYRPAQALGLKASLDSLTNIVSIIEVIA
jgi:hypothetical protein